jgi:integrase
MSTKSASVTDLELRSAIRRMREAGRSGDVGLGDGLQLRVGMRAATFSLKYADRRTGRQERVEVGRYPAIGLGEARRRAKELQARIQDPRVLASPARELRDRAAMPTFRELADERLDAGGRRPLAPATRGYYSWCLATHAHATIGDMAAADVRAEDVIAIVDRAARRTPRTADNVLIAISSVLAYGVRERVIGANVARGIARRSSDAPRDRVPAGRDLALAMRAVDTAWAPTASDDLRRILRLLLLTGARSSEVRLAASRELHWDGYAGFAGPVWVVPGDTSERGRLVRGRSKGGGAIVRPLSRQAAALFREALDAAGERELLFDVAERRAVSYAMQRACSRARLAGERRITPHDFRRALATWLGDRGERPDVVELMLGHTRKGVTRVHYNHSLMLPLVADAYQRWADHLDTLTPSANQAVDTGETRLEPLLA